jgi:hypothetical protein
MHKTNDITFQTNNNKHENIWEGQIKEIIRVQKQHKDSNASITWYHQIWTFATKSETSNKSFCKSLENAKHYQRIVIWMKERKINELKSGQTFNISGRPRNQCWIWVMLVSGGDVWVMDYNITNC